MDKKYIKCNVNSLYGKAVTGSRFHVCYEMQKFRNYLNESNIQWTDVSDESGDIWICRTHFNHEGNLVSVIHGFGSYGGFNRWETDQGLLEVMIGNNEPVGYFTAEDAVKYIFEGADA